MARLTADQWSDARSKWEADDSVTFGSLSRDFGADEAAFRRRAKNEGWMRTGAMRGIAERAHIKADQNVRGMSGAGLQNREAISAAEDIRADVIERHRDDWREHRECFSVSGIAADFDLGKSAKISAEMLKIRQAGERAAYGLDDGAPPPGDTPAGVKIVFGNG